MLHIKQIVGRQLAMAGAHLWQRAFDRGHTDWRELTLLEKLGYTLFVLGLKVLGIPITIWKTL